MAPPTQSAGLGRRQVRIALVLYGGVSLAVYENGVARAFWDLVNRKAGFGLVLDLLDAEAAIDVVSGTSAGGINGIMLAAALESGADFSPTADLWRKHGDLARLLRPPAESDPESLLDGEGYYQRRLYDAFLGLVRPRGAELPGSPRRTEGPADDDTGAWARELDLFVTTTDLLGRVVSRRDALDAVLSDRTHRIVLHLKHRPRRTALGITRPMLAGAGKGPTDADLRRRQALLLACVARMTSTFPVAFPPFRACQLDALVDHVPEGAPKQERADSRITREDVEAVKDALEELTALGAGPASRPGPPARPAGDEGDGDGPWRPYLDGGVLDNKPFGPALQAVFYRMTEGPVERRLFYIEPHPAAYGKSPVPREAPAPHEVAAASLMTVPRHEEFLAELDQLEAHNHRVQALLTLREAGRASTAAAKAAVQDLRNESYAALRTEALAKTLCGPFRGTPTAADIVPAVRGPFYRALRARIPTRLGADLDSWDVEYHVRRCFHVSYRLYDRIQSLPADATPAWRLLRDVGRLTETLEVVRAGIARTREEFLSGVVWTSLSEAEASALADRVIAGLERHLDSIEGPYAPLVERTLRTAKVSVGETGPVVAGPLLDQVSERLWTGERTPAKEAPDSDAERRSVLDEISELLWTVVRRFDAEVNVSGPPLSPEIDGFAAMDVAAFPAEYLSGIHELDEIRVVRVCPADAQWGLSESPNGRGSDEMEKVAGETLGHFAAFLRRDWRSNDLLVGRYDGICQIVRALLDRSARDRVLPNAATNAGLRAILEGERPTDLSGCPDGAWEALRAAAERLRDVASSNAAAAPAAWESFSKALVVVLQERAAAEEVRRVEEDHVFQDVQWDAYAIDGGGPRATDGDNEAAAAKEVARRRDAPPAGPSPRGTEGEFHASMGLGRREREGGMPWVPAQVMADYVTHAYVVVWRLLEGSLRRVKDPVPLLSSGTARSVFLRPVALLGWLTRLLRRDSKVAPALILTTLVALATTAGLSWLWEAPRVWQFGTTAAFLLFSAYTYAVVAPMESLRGWRRWLVLAEFLTLLALAGFAWLAAHDRPAYGGAFLAAAFVLGGIKVWLLDPPFWGRVLDALLVIVALGALARLAVLGHPASTVGLAGVGGLLVMRWLIGPWRTKRGAIALHVLWCLAMVAACFLPWFLEHYEVAWPWRAKG